MLISAIRSAPSSPRTSGCHCFASSRYAAASSSSEAEGGIPSTANGSTRTLWRHYSRPVGVTPDEQAFAAEAMVLGMQADAPIGFAVHDEQLRFELISDS